MSYLNGKKIETLIVPVHCEEEQGTAFFISKKQLLTARHVVKAYFQSASAPAPIYIDVLGKKILCNAEEISMSQNTIDLAILTLNQEEEYEASDFLTLLSDKYVENMPLHVYGYPQEITLGHNLVDLEARNRLELNNVAWSDRTLIRDDKLPLHNFDGLSGSPVVSISGRVIGIIVLQINQTLNYLSISKAKEHFDNKGIPYDTDCDEDDITTMGIGRSHQFCKDAIKTVHDRHMPLLHQENENLENILDYISNKPQFEISNEKITKLTNFISQLPVDMKNKIQERLKIRQEINNKLLKSNGYSILKYCYNFIKTDSPFKFDVNSDKVLELNEIIYQLKDDDFKRVEYSDKKNLCLIGNAGSGKTHSLCDYALKNRSKANIYLFFGTNFRPNQSAIDIIKNTVCQDMNFVDFNQELINKGRYSIIVIDAINEGLGCSYWNNNLGALRAELDKHNHIKLIISVRMPFNKEIIDLSDENWYIHTIDGFSNKINAINAYFKEYKIDHSYNIEIKIEAFKNPLFLKIFCETFHSLTKEEKVHVNKHMLYKQYVSKKNTTVTNFINEDPELNIADRYMSKLAHYSVHYNHFNPISRDKARQYAKRIAPNRLWDKDLLNACLTVNLLLDDRSHTGEPTVMFEYENLGDYYKADELLHSKMTVKELLDWIEKERQFLKKNTDIPSEKFRTALKALFDCWYYQGIKVNNEKKLQKGGQLYDIYYEFLMESDIPYNELISILLSLDTDKVNPLRLIDKFDDISLDETLEIHESLKKYPTIASRDLIWTHYVNQMYEKYGDEYIGEVPLEQNSTLEVSDDEREYLICITWMLSSSHPKFRAIIIRKIRKILQIHQDLILWLIELFKDVNDPYILSGLYCAICGVVLPSRNKKLTADIAFHIYQYYYEKDETIPQDLIIRQWTLKIIERAYYINNECNYWKLIKTPFKPKFIDRTIIPKFNQIGKEYFGLQIGSIKMYNSLFSNYEDFNRYIIGNNNSNYSNDYFQFIKNEMYQGVPLQDIMAEMAYYIKHEFGWNDQLGYLDNGKYSSNRSHNEQERIGKKFQWLAWNKVNANLMDTYYTSKEQYFNKDVAQLKDLTLTPYPWNSVEISRFDPTLDPQKKYSLEAELKEIENQPIKGKEDEDWINKNDVLPEFRFLAKHQDGSEFVMLMGYDISQEDNKETFLFSNAGFIRQKDAIKFADWAKNQNFYGRWMPERQGMIEFLWNDYPWADVYKSSIEHEVWTHARNCPCDIQLSYEAQLQENWDGIGRENEFLSTVYMPCVEMMEQMDLYCSEVRGIIKALDGSIAALNTYHENCINGLYVRRDILNKYLKRNEYVMFYYVLGEKVLRINEIKSIIKELSAAYCYQPNRNIDIIQPMQIIEMNKK